MPKLKNYWVRMSNPEFAQDLGERIRQHRARVTVELQQRGLEEGKALKICAAESCEEETIECDKKRLAKWGWVYINEKWYCSNHNPKQC